VTVFDAAGDPLAHGGGSFRVPRAG
jgi:hypothetical protein